MRVRLMRGFSRLLRKMSEALGVDVGNASKAISFARLPALVLSCFSSPLDLQQAWATDLSVALQKDPDIVLGRARKLSQIVAKAVGCKRIQGADWQGCCFKQHH
jgi:hypothetical protein